MNALLNKKTKAAIAKLPWGSAFAYQLSRESCGARRCQVCGKRVRSVYRQVEMRGFHPLDESRIEHYTTADCRAPTIGHRGCLIRIQDEYFMNAQNRFREMLESVFVGEKEHKELLRIYAAAVENAAEGLSEDEDEEDEEDEDEEDEEDEGDEGDDLMREDIFVSTLENHLDDARGGVADFIRAVFRRSRC